MHPAQIQAELKMRGITQAEVARQCGHVSPTTVYQVVHGRGRSKRIEMRIAAITGRTLTELWPAWYPHARAGRSSVRASANAPAPRRAAAGG